MSEITVISRPLGLCFAGNLPKLVLESAEDVRIQLFVGSRILLDETYTPVTAATWFWADSRLDTGDICKQKIIRIDTFVSPRESYLNDIIPALGRTLKRCLNGVQAAFVRRVEQVEKYVTYDRKFK
ncbi:MAG: hypothetical protein LBP85_04435 [Prevotellaceae bacterium]|jgi:methionyl-tRNA formyltransferase|nr:hypothetical protein [Prevotellaceae bacterium]